MVPAQFAPIYADPPGRGSTQSRRSVGAPPGPSVLVYLKNRLFDPHQEQITPSLLANTPYCFEHTDSPEITMIDSVHP